MRIVCTKCGCPYDDSNPCCPECGTPAPVFINVTGLTNCPNCGAPVSNNAFCEYCGSKYPYTQETEIPEDGYDSQLENSGTNIGSGIAAFLGGVVGSLLE